MASHDDLPPAKKIKRTSFSPWSTTSKGASKKDATGPEPARIVSDISANSADGSKVPGLSSHPKILSVQKEWEKTKQKEGGSDSRAGSTGTDVAVRQTRERREESLGMHSTSHSTTRVSSTPTSHAQKRILLDSLNSRQSTDQNKDMPSLRPTHSGSNGQPAHVNKMQTQAAKAVARRFTEEAVMKQMAALTAKTAADKKAAGGSASPGTGGPSMNFPTPTELLQKIKMDSLAEARDAPQTPGSDSAPVKHVPAPKEGDRLTPIPLAEDGRPYSFYPRPDGLTESGRGALFPANYELHERSDLPFICPVRDCRRLFSGLKGLGGHFAAAHCSTTYNDNGDGTLTKLGNYTKMGPGGSPGIIISKNPLPPNAPPPPQPVEQWLGAQQTRNRATNGSPAVIPPRQHNTRDLSNAKESGTGTQSVTPTPSLSVRTYLHNFLNKDQQSWRRDDIDALVLYPRQRRLSKSWLEFHQGTLLDANHYACAIAYLVGTEINDKAECKAHTRHTSRPTSRLSVPCIALPQSMSKIAKSTFSSVETCVGCKYWCHLQRRSNTCDWSGQEFKPRGTAGVSTSASTPLSEAGESEKFVDAMEVDAASSEPEHQLELEPKRAPEPPRKRDSSKERRQRKREMRREMRRASLRDSFVGVGAQPMQFGSAELEMEEWEVAPGRMRDEEGSENIAFSNSYLTHGKPVTVAEDISFNVLVIKPGGVNNWSVEDDKLRTCSVASGKVKVTMGEKVFQMGPNGMFVVRPGQTCKVENRSYIDSVVHCTTIADFELQ